MVWWVRDVDGWRGAPRQPEGGLLGMGCGGGLRGGEGNGKVPGRRMSTCTPLSGRKKVSWFPPVRTKIRSTPETGPSGLIILF